MALVAAVCQFGLLSRHAEASLDFDLADVPDIAVGWVNVSYKADTDTFLAEGEPQSLKVTPGDQLNIEAPTVSPPRKFVLTGTIDDSGNLNGGSLTITGKVPSLGFDGTLLTGNLTAFASQAGAVSGPIELPDAFRFLFDVTGGVAASLYDAAGFAGNVNLVVKSGFAGGFSSDFDGVNGMVNVQAVVPEPASLILWSVLGSCCAAAVWWRRRGRHAA